MNTVEPLISIIIPVYYTEKYLHRCIDSVLAQSYSNFELILVDDGSKDSSGQICDDYAKQDGRIIVLHQENQGVSIARNRGIDLAKGEYITFIDSDDWVEPNYLQVFVDTPTTEGKHELPILDVQHLDANNQEIYYSGFNALTFCVAKFFDRHLIQKNHIQFPPYVKTAEDTLFMVKYLDCVDGIHKIPYLAYHYETNGQGACERLKADVNTYSVGLIKELQYLQEQCHSKLALEYLHYRTGISFHHFVNALYKYHHTPKERILILKKVCRSTSEALKFYPRRYQTDKWVTFFFAHSLFLLGDTLANLSWKLRTHKEHDS